MPATFALLIDSSQSMSRRIDFVREAASTTGRIPAPAGPNAGRAVLTDAGSHHRSHQRPEDGGRVDRTRVLQGRHRNSRLARRTGSHLGTIEGRRAIVLITDGYDEHSAKRYDETLAAVRAAQATVYVVGIGGVAGISIRGERFLKELAAETGGRAFLPSREEQLELVHDALASDVQNRYLLSYTPLNQTHDGTWRKITVETGEATHKVRARSGYFAPKPPPVRPSIEFTVTDSERRFIDVAAGDLVVEENGVEQTTRHVPGGGQPRLHHSRDRCQRQHEEMGRDRQGRRRELCQRPPTAGCTRRCDVRQPI